MWTVVIFIKENTIETVPLNWLIGSEENLTFWPSSMKGVKLRSMIVNCAEPSSDWNIYEIRFPNHTKKIYDNFLKARNACNRKAEESDVLSEFDYSHKRYRKPRKVDSSDEEECNSHSRLPNPPALPGKSSEPPMVNDSVSSVVEIPLPSTSNSDFDIIAFVPPLTSSCTGLERNNYSTIEEISLPSTPRRTSIDRTDHIPDVEARYTMISKENSEPSTPRSMLTASQRVHGAPKNTNDTVTQFDNRILRQLVLLNHKVNLLSSDVTKIIENMTPDDTKILEDTEIENYFPLKSDEEINVFELFLSDDRHYKKYIQYITKLGGATLAEAVRRTMARVIEDDLLKHYSWFGQKQKKIFGVLKMAQGMKDGIKRNKLLQDAVTEASVEGCMRNWMRHAKDRLHKKARKAAMNRQNP